MGLDQSLTSLGCYKEFKEEIYKFFSVSLEESNFKLIDPPLLIPTVRWKYDYVLIMMIIKKMNAAMKYVQTLFLIILNGMKGMGFSPGMTK